MDSASEESLVQGKLREASFNILGHKILRGVYPEALKNEILRYAQNDNGRTQNDKRSNSASAVSVEMLPRSLATATVCRAISL